MFYIDASAINVVYQTDDTYTAINGHKTFESYSRVGNTFYILRGRGYKKVTAHSSIPLNFLINLINLRRLTLKNRIKGKCCNEIGLETLN